VPGDRAVKTVPAPLTTTGYAILSLLSLRDWSAYELEQQALRSLRFITPRSRSVHYTEPKRLVRAGCARTYTEQRGRRTVAVYAITDTGHAALREWMTTPAEFPVLEASSLIRTLFGGFGDTPALVRTLQTQRDQARDLLTSLNAQAAEYLETGGPFPDRLGWIAINGCFLRDYLSLLDRWSDWAAEQTELLAANPDHAAMLVHRLADGSVPHRDPPQTGKATTTT